MCLSFLPFFHILYTITYLNLKPIKNVSIFIFVKENKYRIFHISLLTLYVTESKCSKTQSLFYMRFLFSLSSSALSFDSVTPTKLPIWQWPRHRSTGQCGLMILKNEGQSSQSLNRIIKKTKRELVFYWCIIALSFTRPIVFHKVRPILHLLSFHKVRLEPSSRRSSFPTDFGQPTSLGYGFARCWIGTLGSFPWLWFHWILDRDSGISLIYSSMSLIRWRGIWLPYESHSYSRCLPVLCWIASHRHSEHRAKHCCFN